MNAITYGNKLARGRQHFSTPVFRSVNVGSVVNVTPRVLPENRISIELDLQDTRLDTPADADELGIGPDGILIPQETTRARLTSTVTASIDEDRRRQWNRARFRS